jgi:hypothetical protein
MRLWPILVPLLGICVAIGEPLVRSASKHRDEAAAVISLRRIQEAQGRFKTATGFYATDVASLAGGCPGFSAALPAATLDDLHRAGYVVQLRAARGALIMGVDCHGRPTASDYYIAATPDTVRQAADKAFAGRADGQLFFFVDGVAPREGDMTGGLAIPIDQLDSFKIP